MRYRSSFEKEVAQWLKDALGSSHIKYEPTKIKYTIEHVYIPDFVLPNGIYIEVKGYLRPRDRQKHLALKAKYPDLDVRFIFKSDNKLNSKSKTRYSDWCKKHGFKYAINELPKSWLQEKSKKTKRR